MVIIGIDPGTAILGYGIVRREHGRLASVGYGAVRTPAKTPAAHRLHTLHRGITELIERYRPDVMAVEQLFFNRNVTTAMSVGQARGVVLLAGAQAGLEIGEYTPLQVKQAVTGNGKANKDQVGYMVRLLLGIAEIPSPDDVADALAVAVCHAHTNATVARWTSSR